MATAELARKSPVPRYRAAMVSRPAGSTTLVLATERRGGAFLAYAVGFTGRVVRANQESGNKYPLLWKTLLYSVDYWAVVKGSPNAKEGFKMVDWITDSKPLLALAEDWAVSPAKKLASGRSGSRSFSMCVR